MHESEAPVGQPWGARRREFAAQLGRLVSLIAIIALIAIGLAAIAVILQARRDEARRSDALLIIAPAPPSLTLVDHSVELFRRGYAQQALLAGPGRANLRSELVQRGVPEAALELAPANNTGAQHLADAMATAKQNGVESLLVISEPGELLLGLKVAHDAGLRAYGSAAPLASPALLAVLQGAVGYWQYVLLGR